MNESPDITRRVPDTGRQPYLDNIRIFCTIGILFYHGTRFFDGLDWHMKSAAIDTALTTWGFFLIEWLLCLLFFVSGASALLARRKQSLPQWLGARSLRLLVPFVFGVFTLAPLQIYLGRVSHGVFRGGFIAWYPQYFHGFYMAGGNFAWMGLHLWFLAILFGFSVTSLPLERVLSGMGNSRLFQLSPLAILALALAPLILIETLIKPAGLGTKTAGLWSMFYFFTVYLYGFVFIQMDELQEYLRNRKILCLLTALVSCWFLLRLRATIQPPDAYGTSGYLLYGVVRVIHCSAWILFLVGIFQDKANFTNATLKYAGEATLPFYILHQPVLVYVGYVILSLPWSPLAQYLATVMVSAVAILAIYHFVVQRVAALRFLFGMRPRPSPVRTP